MGLRLEEERDGMETERVRSMLLFLAIEGFLKRVCFVVGRFGGG